MWSRFPNPEYGPREPAVADPEGPGDDPTTGEPDPLELARIQEQREAVERAVTCLAAGDRELYRLRYAEQASYQEISLSLEITVNNVGVRLARLTVAPDTSHGRENVKSFATLWASSKSTARSAKRKKASCGDYSTKSAGGARLKRNERRKRQRRPHARKAELKSRPKYSKSRFAKQLTAIRSK